MRSVAAPRISSVKYVSSVPDAAGSTICAAADASPSAIAERYERTASDGSLEEETTATAAR
ncbi:hypothetical protein [uncultured Microbacterium sp.]|uniref:hypothetical protein n=1 Tax=uncultured Microbacterium sp. TaxID=191216 RepID=UPI0028D7171A|nr:hypothetical protein [uncultured Microbacterium sp.]